MKKLLYRLLILFVIVGFITVSDTKENAMAEDMGSLGPVVSMATPLVKMDKKVEVIIMGTGFKPGQEIILLFTDVNGATADIDHALKQKPKADLTGTWWSTWNAGRYIKKKLIKEGFYTISVADSNYDVIAKIPVYFYKKDKK